MVLCGSFPDRLRQVHLAATMAPVVPLVATDRTNISENVPVGMVEMFY